MSDSRGQSEKSGAKKMFHRHLGYIIAFTKILLALGLMFLAVLIIFGLTRGFVAAQFGESVETYYVYGLLLVGLYLVKLYQAHIFH